MRKGKFFICDHCGSIIPKDPEENNDTPLMLVVRDDIWRIISGNRKMFMCPDCMVKIWGRKFSYEELKSFSYGFIPANLWYLRRNGFISRAKEDLDYKEIKSLRRGHREFYIRCIDKLFNVE